jgi:hypothetical protein
VPGGCAGSAIPASRASTQSHTTWQRQELGVNETTEEAEFVGTVAKGRARFDLGQGISDLPMRSLKDDIAVGEAHRRARQFPGKVEI